jgi:hypothetical protein
MAGYRMFFWGPIFGPGAVKKKGWLLCYEIKNLFATQPSILFFLFSALNLMDAWQQIKLGSVPTTCEKPGSRLRKGAAPVLDCVPAKKTVLFCDGGVFFIDRGLLMGANM